MKLAIWHNIMWSRYKAVVFSALYRDSVKRGVQVTIYQIAETELRRASLAPVDISWHDYPYVLVFKGSYSAVPAHKMYWQLMKQVWLDNADLTVLTGYEKPQVWLQVAAILVRGKKFAWFCDSTILDKKQRYLTGAAKRILFGLSSGIFCYGERAAEYVSHYGVPPHKIFHRCQAAALPRDYSPEKALTLRLEYAAMPDEPRYLYVGRLSPEKSLDKLLQAFVDVIKLHDKAKLVIVGTGPQENELKQLALRLGIDAHVEFAGSKFDQALFDEYLKATCVVLPSYSEPWGLVVNESLSHGCPAIVSNRCGCIPELIVEEKTGYAFDWERVDDLIDKLNRAPDAFKDIKTTAVNCLKQISPFTPAEAAQNILYGCHAIVGK